MASRKDIRTLEHVQLSHATEIARQAPKANGQGTVPKEQKTQQPPGLGFRIAPHSRHLGPNAARIDHLLELFREKG